MTPFLLSIFSRFPQPGTCKTRLIPRLGAEGAAKLQQDMTEHVLRVAGAVASDVQLCLAGGDVEAAQSWLGEGVSCTFQQGADLGARMLHQFEASFAMGYQRVVLVGADCPAIDTDLLEGAFAGLASHDVVLGPTLDGGYYCIGLSEAHGPLFSEISWGTGRVAKQTLKIATGLGLSVKTLPTLQDIDEPDDLAVLPTEWLS